MIPDGDIYGHYRMSLAGDAFGTMCEMDYPSGAAIVPGAVLYAVAYQDLDGDGEMVVTVGCETEPDHFFYPVEVRGRTGQLMGTADGGCAVCGAY